jgi:hypothetical protein
VELFLCVWRLQDLDVELTVSGGAVIHVKLRHVVNTYFDLPMLKSMKV